MSEKRKILSGFVWSLLEKVGSQGVTFFVSIVLARILMPEQYGLVAMLSIVMVVCRVFIDCGFGTALVQKKESDALDFNTVLYSSTLIGIVLYIVSFFCAPLCARFFNESQLTVIMRVYTLSFIWSGYNSVLLAYISKQMLFKKMFKRSLISNTISGIVGIVAACMGGGVWALVIQSLVCSVLGIVILQLTIDWKPKLQYSWSRAKTLLSFSSKIMLASFIGTSFNELKGLLVGKMYSAADLALFNKGGNFPNLIADNINNSLGTVLFPAMSIHNDDRNRIRDMTSRAIRLGSYVQFFFLTILIVISEPLIRVLLTEKWIACVPFMRMVCLQRMLEILSAANLQALKAVGEGNSIVKLEILKKPVFLIMTVVGAHVSVFALAVTLPLYAFYANIVNMWPNKKALNYGIVKQIKDVMPATFLSVVMFGVGYPINYIMMPDLAKIVCCTLICLVMYIVVSHLFRVDSYMYCLNICKEIKKKCMG